MPTRKNPSYVLPDTKDCPVCGSIYHVSQFGEDASQPDGLNRRCRRCVRAEAFASNKEDQIGTVRPYTSKATPTPRGTTLIRIGDQLPTSHAIGQPLSTYGTSPLAWAND